MNMDIKVADMNLYEYICEHSRDMIHNELFYNLLDWKDQHPEVREALAKKHDSYTIKWYDEKEGMEKELTYTDRDCHNPYITARRNYLDCFSREEVSCAELWHNANPYESEMIRTAVLLESFEKEY